MKKKLLSLALATMVLFATQMGTVTPSYAGTPDSSYARITTHKIDGHLLYGNYTYKNVHIEDGKLTAEGNWGVYGKPDGCTVEFQIIRPLYDSYFLSSDGTASLGVCYRTNWTLPEPVSVVRSATCKGEKSVSFAIDTKGIPDGIYELQEVVTKGAHKEGNITEDMFLVVQGGVPSIQVTPYPFPQITGFWSNDKTFIGWYGN